MRYWETMKLGDVVDTLKGAAFKSALYRKKGVPIVRVTDFTDNSISTEGLVYYDYDDLKGFEKYKLCSSDILVQTVGSWQHNPASIVGKVVKVPKKHDGSFLNQNIVKLIVSPKADQLFLYYRLKDETFKFHVLGSAQGAANQASITLDTIRRFEFLLPPLTIQKRIAEILSAYDDLIENNGKRIKLLEELAQRTYEEWFVRFRVNGEQLPIEESTGLPVGWEMKKIGEVCDISGGGTPSKAIAEYWENGDITWFSPTDLSKSTSLFQIDSSSKITTLGLQKSSAKLLQPNSFMMTSRATIGLFGLIDKPFCTNQGFINVTPFTYYQKEFLLYNFITRIEEFKG
ncbi:MAG: hypothetical protein EBZ77_09310, partial [Chitinophagia bacterium]|nr:hypothetical protein [Chitinophagia bacterium]